MAALLLRRAFPSSLVQLASRSPPPGSSFSVLGNRLFISRFITSSTTAAMEHTSLLRSLTGGFPSIKAEPRLPIPDGFPFTLTKQGDTLTFLRQDKDGKFEVEFDLESPKIINGDCCFDTRTSILRGEWVVDFDVVAGSKTFLIQQFKISRYHKRNLHSFEQFVESKGITKGIIQSLLSLAKNKDGKIDCFERRPGKERATPFIGPLKGIVNQAENLIQPPRE